MSCANLILSPHIDDEVLGCFSFLSADTHVIYFGVEEREQVTSGERLKEQGSVQQKKGFSWQLEKFKVNSYLENELIATIENSVNDRQPERILIPFPSYNQDHRAVYHAARVAVRPHDINYFVKEVLVYEQPHAFLWSDRPFEPNYFKEINIDEKIQAYQCYRSQVRTYRSPELLRAMAELRGTQAGLPFAEGFHCLRYVSD
ncbi:MAG: hypothetical protein JW801_03830 [Bacteroidales bacterium]|nr:hypothetical protein [Bacteroidales bacterium]